MCRLSCGEATRLCPTQTPTLFRRHLSSELSHGMWRVRTSLSSHRRYKHDPRVVLWDLFNEPDNANCASYGSCDERVPSAADAKGTELSPLRKAQGARALLELVFQWVREEAPSQPLTTAIYWAPTVDEAAAASRDTNAAWVLDHVDVVSFHEYGALPSMQAMLARLTPLNRPLICSEYLARQVCALRRTHVVSHRSYCAAHTWPHTSHRSATRPAPRVASPPYHHQQHPLRVPGCCPRCPTRCSGYSATAPEPSS